MENPEASTQLLKNKYNLHASPEVESAASRVQGITGERIPQDPLLRIQNYLDRFADITDREDPKDRQHGMDAAKRLLHSKFVIKPQEIPESYFENQRRMARELGHGDIEISEEMRDQLTEVVIADQRSSLDKWVNYLSSNDAPYPDSLKYFTLRSILSMGEYDKEKHVFSQRSKGTVKPFPDLNREALSYVLDSINKKYSKQHQNVDNLNEAEKLEFQKLLQSENFAKLYAFAIDKVTPASEEALADTRGEWVKYPQNSDHVQLVTSLQGHGTGWCTAGESTAQAQLQNGDFYVYYSLDNDNKPTIPRCAIRMQGNKISEVRGVAPEQNLDPYINDVVAKKLEEFPDGKEYQKKSFDMKRLTAIEYKTIAGQELTSEDLTFLYEINSPIEGFGYEKDPRIEEILKQRNPKEDMPTVFDCEPSQIAHITSEIDESTKAFVGSLTPGIFDKLGNIDHVYTSFPEGKISFYTVTIGGKSKKQIERELKENNINVSPYATSMMENQDFTTLPDPEICQLVKLSVKDLGTKNEIPTTTELFKRAQELGLKLCPPETGPQYRVKYMDQSLDDWLYVGMKPITDSDDDPSVFCLGRRGDGLWLSRYWARPDRRWFPGDRFVFSRASNDSEI